MPPSNTRSTIIETMARAIVRAKGAEVCASDTEWPLAVAHHRAMAEKHGAAYTNSRSLYTDAFNFAESALTAYESHLQASGMAVVPVAHLEPFAKYYRSRMAVQMRGMDDCIHRIHPGSEHEAEISVSDCGRLAAVLPPRSE